MGFMQNVKDNMAAAQADQVMRNVKPRDGRVHVLMLMSFSKLVNQAFGCDDKYTNEVDGVLSELQIRGYEIVDIKLGVLPNQGITGQREGYLTCIMYR
jgi:hypothetical protein